MNVNPVSFGRTVKVNAPLNVAEHTVNLINDVTNKKGESRVQQQLKSFFFDAEQGKGRARIVAPEGKHGDIFIVTGEESKAVSDLVQDRKEQLNAAKTKFGESEIYSAVKEAENTRLKDLLTLMLLETKEPVELEVEYSQRKHRIKSIDLIF